MLPSPRSTKLSTMAFARLCTLSYCLLFNSSSPATKMCATSTSSRKSSALFMFFLGSEGTALRLRKFFSCSNVPFSIPDFPLYNLCHITCMQFNLLNLQSNSRYHITFMEVIFACQSSTTGINPAALFSWLTRMAPRTRAQVS